MFHTRNFRGDTGFDDLPDPEFIINEIPMVIRVQNPVGRLNLVWFDLDAVVRQ